jgi:hypothetical protein
MSVLTEWEIAMLDQTQAKYVENENARRLLCEIVDQGFVKGYRWGAEHKDIEELEILRSYFILKARLSYWEGLLTGYVLSHLYKSIVTCILKDSKVFNIENDAALKTVGFFKGAIEALKHRKMTQRLREENKSELRRSLDRRKATATAAAPETRAQNTPRPLRSLSA